MSALTVVAVAIKLKSKIETKNVTLKIKNAAFNCSFLIFNVTFFIVIKLGLGASEPFRSDKATAQCKSLQ